jgi:hypothetical protein
LEGKIISSDYVTIKATFEPNFAITPVIEDYEGILRIEPTLSQSNFEIFELSSLVDYPANNLIIPIEGETLLKLSLDGNKIVLEGRTNKDLIQDIDYNISARLFSSSAVVVLGDFNNDFNLDFF